MKRLLLPAQFLLAILSLCAIAIPVIQKAVKNGTITKEQQQEVLTRYNALADAGDTAFQGPEWDVV